MNDIHAKPQVPEQQPGPRDGRAAQDASDRIVSVSCTARSPRTSCATSSARCRSLSYLDAHAVIAFALNPE